MVRITNRNRRTISKRINVNDQNTHLRVLSLVYSTLRKKYLEKLSTLRNRNIIAYYSAFLHRTEENKVLSINDEDKNGLMSVIHKLDTTKGLDIILHTPGGDIAATESFIEYLYQKFGINITAIVPQLAMSGGTLIACSCQETFMGTHSNIGPIDPQI